MAAEAPASTMYGTARGSPPTRVGTVRSKLSPELLDYLASDPMLVDETGPGFQQCSDYPDVPGHTYYEGYFHSQCDAAPVWSVNPRTGSNFHKPAAGIRLRAFLELARRNFSAHIESAIKDLRKNRSAETLLSLVRAGKLFGDCAVQVHYGDAIEPPGRLGWHCDAPNSLIHMGIALHGRRALHCKLKSAIDGDVSHTVQWQEPGDVYVSSPTCFEHAVQYPECCHGSRVIAVQARLLVDEAELYGGFHGVNQERDWCELMDALGPAISSFDKQLPSLEDVKGMVHQIATDKADAVQTEPSIVWQRPSHEAMQALATANEFEAAGDLTQAKHWIIEATRLGHSLKKEHGGWK